MNLILASKSPRRAQLLKKMNINFKVEDSKLDESKYLIKNPKEYCQKLANAKAKSVLAKFNDSTIIGADTIVEIDNEILEKPSDFKEAYNMLRKLSGKKHNVFTGISIISSNFEINFVEKTTVKFFEISKNDIQTYIKKNKPYDKSGSYGIQDESMIFVDYIVGNYENIIGLPVSRVYKCLKKLKII